MPSSRVVKETLSEYTNLITQEFQAVHWAKIEEVLATQEENIYVLVGAAKRKLSETYEAGWSKWVTFMNQASRTELMGNIEINTWVKYYVLGRITNWHIARWKRVLGQ